MKIVILTGAGISAESGIRTFRASDGLWEEHRIEDVATPEAYERDPVLVHRFYNMRRRDAQAALPNAGHIALGKLTQDPRHEVLLVTQNVDDLHERGGAQNVLHMHGELNGALCHHCAARWPAPAVMEASDLCPQCAKPQTRPDIVWFGEMPYQMERIWAAIEDCDLFAAIGTSGQVYPAAAFGQIAARAGVETVEINLAASAVSSDFDRHIIGPASETVPLWVAELTGD